MRRVRVVAPAAFHSANLPFTRRYRGLVFRPLLPLVLALAAAPSAAQAPLPLHVFEYDRATPLELRDSVEGEREGVSIHRVSFASPGGGRATGRLFVPRGAGPFAGVVLGHGLPGSSETFIGRGVYIAKHGAVVIAVDAPFNRRPGPPITLTPRDSAEQVQLIQDLQRAVDVLAARRDVDAGRLAYVGRSYGGATGALLAGVERRLKTYILAVADGGITTRFTAPGAPPPPQGQEERSRAWLAAMQPIEGIRFVHRANGTILFQNARRDQFVSVDRAEALHRAAGPGHVVKWYDTEHALDAAAHVDQLAWLHEKIGTAAPGPEDAAGPEIPAPPARRQP